MTDEKVNVEESQAEGLDELRKLTRLAGVELKDDILEVVAEIVQLDVIPTAVSQVLRSLCNKARTQQQNKDPK